jgi:hypothetical protein
MYIQYLKGINSLIQLKKIKVSDNKKKFVLPIIRPTVSHWLEYVIAIIMSKRGHEVLVIYDLFNNLKFTHKYQTSSKNILMKYIVNRFMRQVFFLKNVPIYLLLRLSGVKVVTCRVKSKFRGEVNQKDRHFISSMRRYLAGNNVSNWPFIDSYVQNSIENDLSIIYFLIKKYCTKESNIFISHGIYHTWGPFYDFYLDNMNDIRILVYGASVYRPGSIIFCNGPLQISMPIQIKSHAQNDSSYLDIKDRVNGDSIDQESYIFETSEVELKGNEIIIKNKHEFLFNISKDPSYVVSLFPNCIWDGDITERDKLFTGILDWINKTVSLISDDSLIIIRAHPAEATLWSHQSKLRGLLAHDILNRVVFIPPGSKISSFDVARASDLCVVYDSTIGVEFAYEEIPVIMAAKSRYNYCPGIKNPSSIDEYQKAINQKFSNVNTHKELIGNYWNEINNSLLYSLEGYKGEGFSSLPDFKKMKKNNQIEYLVDDIVSYFQ